MSKQTLRYLCKFDALANSLDFVINLFLGLSSLDSQEVDVSSGVGSKVNDAIWVSDMI